MYDSIVDLRKKYEKLFELGLKLSKGNQPKPLGNTSLPMETDRHSIILCSPHPDDEALSGALAYRLQTNNDRVTPTSDTTQPTSHVAAATAPNVANKANTGTASQATAHHPPRKASTPPPC